MNKNQIYTAHPINSVDNGLLKWTVVIVAMLLLSSLMFSSLNAAEKIDGKKIRFIRVAEEGSELTKAELNTRTGKGRKEGKRLNTSEGPYEPTILNLTFPTLVYPGESVKGKLKFNDPDDYILSIFITVFYPDGDVVTDTLYDYRVDGGDLWKGSINFWVDMPESETPLPGKIVITCADDYLNVSEVTKNFVQDF